MQRWGAVAVAAFVVASCAGCAAPGPDTLAGYIWGSWDCAMEESVADADLYPKFLVTESDVRMTVTHVGEDMSGSGRTPEPWVEDPVDFAYRVVDGAIEVEVDDGSATFVIQAAEEIPRRGSIPLLLNGQDGYTAEVDPAGFRVTLRAPEGSDRDADEIIRCERLFDY